jgi:subtilisin-like proprotein convertase family protein
VRIGLRAILAVVGTSVLGAFAAASAAALVFERAELPNTDVREDVKPSAAEARAVDKLGVRLGADGFADVDAGSGGVAFIGRTDGYLTAPSDAPATRIALDYVRAHQAAFGLDDSDLASLSAPDAYTSIDHVTHITWQQSSDGISSYDTYLAANLTRDGRLINLSGGPVGDLALNTAKPSLSATDALAAARRNVGGSSKLPDVAGRSGSADRATTFATEQEAARLTAFARGDGSAKLAWRVQVSSVDSILYEVVVDATDGTVLARRSLTDFAVNDATIWRYFPDQTQSPTTVNLGADPTWIDRSAANGDILLGNNADAYSDINGTNGRQAGEEVTKTGSGDWVFNTTFFVNGGDCPVYGCTSDTAATLSNNRQDATTDLFYSVNLWHDHLLAAPIGFDEASRNFEFTNSSGQGAGNDPVLAEANDSSGIDNANFSTVPDGTPGRMQMYLWNGTSWNPPNDMNGTYSWDVVFHEYTHGLSNRLIGNGGGLGANQSGAMGEGWSDWYAMDYLVGQGLQPDTSAPGEVWLGQYVTGVPGLFGGNSRIRHQAIDCTVGASAAACPANGGSGGTGGYTCGDMGHVGPNNGVHDNGEIWSQTLWDLRTALGSSDAEAIITGGMRLSPSNPTMIQERDAILQSAQTLGVNMGTVWQVFAHRGFGYFATTPGASSFSCAEDFTVPTPLVHTGTTYSDPAPLGDGDGLAEPGETLSVTSTLKNTTGATITGISGHMSSPTAGVIVGEPDRTWPDINGGASAGTSQPFAVTIPASQTCGTSVSLSFTATSSAGNVPAWTKSVPIGGASFTNSTDAGLPRAIPDNNPVGINSDLTAALPGGTVTDLDVRIGSLTHTFDGDLIIKLTHGLTTVTLFNRRGGSGDNITNLVFDDEAASAIAAGAAPFTGSFRPESPLSAFDGQSTSGPWTLNVSDNAGVDTGSLDSWGLSGVPDCDVIGLPAISTDAASGVGASGATLNGSLDSNGIATDYAFEYGPTTSYGTRTTAAAGGSGASPVPVNTAISGLPSSTTFHYRALALRGGTVVARGGDRSFETTSGGGGGGQDTTPPDTVIDSGPNKKTKKKKAKFSFHSTESPASFECKVDDGGFASCASPATFTVKKGKHTFGVRAIDAANNVDPSAATRSWKVKKKKKHKHHHDHHH